MPESPGIKPKDLCLIPFRVALAAQADGWYVRSVIIWSKPNPMPESVKDRPTESHEYILMLTKSKNYYFDMEAVREKQSNNSHDRGDAPGDSAYQEARGSYFDFYHKGQYIPTGPLNIRSVWEITTQPFKGAHFATFPEEIPRRCILASTSEKGNCAKCGKPWVRVTEKTRLYQPGSGKAHNKPGGKRIDNPECHRMKYSQGPCVSVKTLGWEPSCKCAPASWKGSRFDDGKNLEIHPNVGRREDAHTKSQYEDGSTAKRLALLRQQARQNGEEYSSESITTGWENSCNCGAGIVRPVVLDPFGGSGTVSKVAKELGRKSIYIDTSEKYTEMARKRIELIPIPMEIT
jgi:hypothetical protein